MLRLLHKKSNMLLVVPDVQNTAAQSFSISSLVNWIGTGAFDSSSVFTQSKIFTHPSTLPKLNSVIIWFEFSCTSWAAWATAWYVLGMQTTILGSKSLNWNNIMMGKNANNKDILHFPKDVPLLMKWWHRIWSIQSGTRSLCTKVVTCPATAVESNATSPQLTLPPWIQAPPKSANTKLWFPTEACNVSPFLKPYSDRSMENLISYNC